MTRPVARESGLLVEEIGDELLVFDADRQVAHSLNQLAVSVWRACDGTRDPERIAVECELGLEVVKLTLAELAGIELLEGEEAKTPVVSRRQVLRRAVLTGAAVGVALPVIRSITVPSAALAQSGIITCGSPCHSTNGCSKVVSGPSGCAHCAATGSCQTSCGPRGRTCFILANCCFGLTCQPNAPPHSSIKTCQ